MTCNDSGERPGDITPEALRARIEAARREIGWDETAGTARTWWSELEAMNGADPRLLLRLIEELRRRGVTINELFVEYVRAV